MKWFEKFQTVIVMLAILIGFSLGQIAWIAEYATFFIMPFLLLMLYGVFLQTPLTDLGTALRNGKVVGANLVLNFAWTPVLAWVLGALFLREAPDLWVGFIMLMVTPCTDWYLIFTSIARGNVALATSLLPINLILQIVLLPVYIFVFAGTLVQIELGVLISSVLMVLVVPLFLALTTRRIIIQRKGGEWFESLLAKIPGSQTFLLSLVVASMFASQGTAMMENLHVFLILLIPLALFYVINFGLAQVTSRFFTSVTKTMCA